jgi:hypothetical protein
VIVGCSPLAAVVFGAPDRRCSSTCGSVQYPWPRSGADILIQAAHWFGEENVDFIDAYTAALMLDHGLTNILTLDRKHFHRFEELNGITP